MHVSWVRLHRLLGAPEVQVTENDRHRKEVLRWECGCSATLDTLRFYDVVPCEAHAGRTREASFSSVPAHA
jgi:hypothetical protein